ncbi:MAG: response regulator [Treponema sp.]|nr:response regulator [Treponema sp.]
MIIKSDMPGMNDKSPAGKKPDGTPYRVLVVDDSMFIAKQLGQIFTSEGFEVAATAADGAQGVDKYKELHPTVDIVTMDITMPVMDGVSALEKILEFDKNACVVMVSALGKEDIVKKSLLMGAKSYIVKPLDRKKVLERVAQILATRK